MKIPATFWLSLILGFIAAWKSGAATERATAAGTSDSLVLSGKFAGLPDADRIAVTRAELLAVPGVVELNEKPASPIPAAKLKVLPLDRLLDRWPLKEGADGLVLICADRWETFLSRDLILSHRPYLMLLYGGRTPAEGWPRFSKLEGLAPYFCNVSRSLGPPLDGLQEHGEVDATQVVEVRAVNTAERYAPFYTGSLVQLSTPAAAGRKIFLQHCNTCHQGPGGVGGNVSQRPLVVLQVHATSNPDYFRKFVRNPKQFMPQTLMPKHENFDDETLDDLMAFLAATKLAEAK